ncbi:MAG: UDP-2,3-diacylglucosamine hydrolase [Betaproteobacteria bacterium ADurb.Bin341]|nr:MAG: UDP-2,3-diacylglucosamine hydrolase [Betaproteobacteria bacterium ADurb.Bin341]
MIHFIADLHLSSRAPGVTRIFLDYLAGPARQAEALYILGDLFEAWIGDDDDDPVYLEITSALKAAGDSGISILIQRGNRDFLLGERFAAASGTRILPDPYPLSLPGKSFVLSHGDALCTGDTEYQTFRCEVRTPAWQSAFLAKPLTERRRLAAQLRQISVQNKKEKDAALMDLDQSTTENLIRSHNYATFIHGHTHRPATHHHLVDGIAVERWVLADWQEDRGEVLVWDGKTLQRQELS